MDIVKRLVWEKQLAERLNRRSVEAALKHLDMLNEKQEAGLFLDPEYIREARAAAERFLSCGYQVAKCSVLLPAGLLGACQGFSLPDADISLLGIGNHRFFLFHSALSLALLRYFHKQWLARQQNPQGWWSRAQRKAAGAALGCLALGVGVHLAIDVFQPKSVVFPFIGSLAEGTLIDDNLWLLGNSLWAFRIAHDVFTLSLAEEIGQAKEWVAAHFQAPPQAWDRIRHMEQ